MPAWTEGKTLRLFVWKSEHRKRQRSQRKVMRAIRDPQGGPGGAVQWAVSNIGKELDHGRLIELHRSFQNSPRCPGNVPVHTVRK